MTTHPTDPTGPSGETAHPLLTAYLAQARWFAGKGLAYEVVDTERVGTLPGPPTVTVELVTVRYPGDEEGGDTAEIYQLPISHYAEPQDRLRHALIGYADDDELGPTWAYDAVHDREAMAVYLRAFAATEPGQATAYGGLRFRRASDHELDTTAYSSLFSGEQSNSSVAFGEDSLLKLFRKVTPGRNPDIEIHRALTEEQSPHVAALYGWVEAGDERHEPLDLGLIQQFLRTATDGWELARSSARALFAQELRDDAESGGDFVGEAHRLGSAVAEVHEVLRTHFPTHAWAEEDMGVLAEAMRERLEAHVSGVPALAAYAEGARAVFARVHDLSGPIAAQRVHGDLHLGQTLRVVHHWKLVDFEGEPAKPLAERVMPDSPWRDVAGMLRSFDYAARSVLRDVVAEDGEEADELGRRADQWVSRNREAFVAGYLGDRAIEPEEQVILDAYEVDKAVYEVGYEARNRPGWLPIPLAALARLTTSENPTPPDPANQETR